MTNISIAIDSQSSITLSNRAETTSSVAKAATNPQIFPGRLLTHDTAIDRISHFTQKFGEAHLTLACHAAFPLALTPDLLYQIWANFTPEVPWTAVADLLLSRLCKEVGYELFEMDKAVRTVLLQEIVDGQPFGRLRLSEMADFLQEYVALELNIDDPYVRDLAQAQQWTALAFLDPSKVDQELTSILQNLVTEYNLGKNKETIDELTRLISLVESFVEPLDQFIPLLSYAQEVKRLLHDGHRITSESTEFEDDVSPSHIARLHLDLDSTLTSRSSFSETPIEIDEQATSQPFEAVEIELKRLPPLPTADYSGSIEIEPSKEEQQAFDQLFQALPPNFTLKEYELLLSAYKVASYAHRNQQREGGEPYMLHPIAVTKILVDMHMDVNMLAAALLHDVAEDSEFSIEYIQEQFGQVISMLVDGVTKLKRINELGNTRSAMSDSKAESLRKMFLAMVEDFRVVLIKLADRLHNMRTLGSQKDYKRRRIARETLEIFAPLANRLGIWKIKSELEDLSFRYLEPASYRDIAKAIQQKQDERDKWVIRIKAELEKELAKAGINAEVSARTKHIYSIWRKMKRKDVSFDQIYDVYGFRVIVDSEAHCYFALGVVHSLWRPIPGEFDDYIANPKNNMYRSLHTAVLSKRSGRPMEVQIRTQEMHKVAEYGIAVHWQNKEQAKHDADFQSKVAWRRQLMEWRQEVTDADEFMDSMKMDVFKDRVFVFTPQGDVVDLPSGATPIDFAYAVHTELGNRCRGANVNGRLVPLDYKLKNGDQVTVIAAKRGGPSRDWLNPDLEYVATQRARSKIRTWLRKQGREENVQRGRQMLEKEMHRLSVTQSVETISKLFNYENVDDFYAEIGYGEINSRQIAQQIFNKERIEQERQAAVSGTSIQAHLSQNDKYKLSDEVIIKGDEELRTQLGRCCNPIPGIPIIGYLTKGSGVTIHRTDCPHIITCIQREQTHRLINVEWKVPSQDTYLVKIQISAFDRSGLMRDIAILVADEQINLLSVEALTGQRDNAILINAKLEIKDAAQLMRLLTKIDRLPNIIDVRRIVE